MQQLLISWLLIGVLLLPADRVGLLQALMGLPGIVLMLWGGANADRTDPRRLLMMVYAIAPIFPVMLIAIVSTSQLAVWSVTLWGLGMSIVMSYSTPAQQAILNRVASGQLQQAISAATAAGFIVQMIGLSLAGQMDRIGISTVLWCQGGCLLVSAWMIRRLAPMPPSPKLIQASAWQTVRAGVHAAIANRTIMHILIINFVSTIFNAGAFMTAFPLHR